MVQAAFVEQWMLMAGVLCLSQMINGANCPAKKFTLTPDHSACLGMSSLADKNNRGVSKSDADTIVNLHNKLRASIKDASDMQLMVWDEELAEIAQKWSDNCDFKHDSGGRRSIPGRLNVGQNLGINQKDWSSLILRWFDEKTVFTYGDESLNKFEEVGHYTQVVWASTSKIGCGFTQCTGKGRFYVCNYGPSGNNDDWTKPYSQSTQCASCPGHCITSGDNEGLCDCGGKTCYNRGTLDLHTCTCKCIMPLYIAQKDCALNCTGTVDHGGCGNTCNRGMESYCPHQCDLCPYAAFDYNGADSLSRQPSISLVVLLSAVIWSGV